MFCLQLLRLQWDLEGASACCALSDSNWAPNPLLLWRVPLCDSGVGPGINKISRVSVGIPIEIAVGFVLVCSGLSCPYDNIFCQKRSIVQFN